MDFNSIKSLVEELLQFALRPYIFPFYFVALWVAVSYTLSKKSGWSRLTEKYQFSQKFEGQYFRFQSAKMNKINFNSALEIGVNDSGMYLVPMILLRLFHKPILIPWNEIQAEPLKRFLFKGYRLTFRSFPSIKMEISDRTFDKIHKYLSV